MTQQPDSTPLGKSEVEGIIRSILLPLERRLQTLEEEVFGRKPPGPGAHIALRERLELLDKKILALDSRYAARTREIIETIAELREIVAEIRKIQEQSHYKQREMETGA